MKIRLGCAIFGRVHR